MAVNPKMFLTLKAAILVACLPNFACATYGKPEGRVATAVTLNPTPGDIAGPVLSEAFVSYAFEFSSFPDFAGNSTSGPNVFSDNLLNNIGNITGTKPYIRVGGNTQDYAVYDPDLSVALIGIIDPQRQPNYPTNVTVGPSFFESYSTWPGCRYTHGFNLARSNGTYGDQDLLGPVEPACRALGAAPDRLLRWEIGNEVDVYRRGRYAVRPAAWSEGDFAREWVSASRRVRARMAQHCPELAAGGRFGFWTPSYGDPTNGFDTIRPWQEGIDVDGVVAEASGHFYMSGFGVPGVTLQGTLLNHSNVVWRAADSVNVSAVLRRDYGLAYAITEANSLYNAGQPDVSNVFGGALWTLDFNLWCAAAGIARVHMQQGLNFRYASWQPRDTDRAPRQTKPSYYGDVAVASALGNLKDGAVRVANLPMENKETEAAYATYVDGVLRRVVLINMQTYNYSTAVEGEARPGRMYSFGVPAGCGGEADTVTVQRLMANGSDVLSGVTFNGISYNVELDEGRPVVQGNVTRDESLGIGEDGIVNVVVPDASAAIVQLECTAASAGAKKPRRRWWWS